MFENLLYFLVGVLIGYLVPFYRIEKLKKYLFDLGQEKKRFEKKCNELEQEKKKK